MMRIIKFWQTSWKRKTFLSIMVLIMCVVSLSIGAQKINWAEVFIKGTSAQVIFFNSRLPRTISVLIAGVGMSISGVIYQQISRNKFVSPTTSGSINGAQLGIAIALGYFGSISTTTMMLFAFAFALLTTVIFMGLMNRLKFKEIVYVPLLGLMLGSFISALTTFIAYQNNQLQVIQAWFYGSFSLITTGRYELLWIVVPGIVISVIYAKAFTIVGMGNSFATNLGIRYQSVVRIGMALIALISAAVVIVVGRIPFLDLVIPNIVSLYSGDNLEKNMYDVAVLGVLFLLVCDVIARSIIYPYELPIALVVGTVGCGIFLFLLLRRNGGKSNEV